MMKKWLLCTVAILSFTLSHAQNSEDQNPVIGFSKGSKFISGSIGFLTTSYPDDSKKNSFNFTPRAGYFINDFVAVGIRLGYSSEKEENAAGVDITDNKSITGGIFGRYYILPGNRFSLYGELGLGFGTIKNEISDDTENGVNVSFVPGLSYFVSEHFALEASIGLLRYDSVRQNVDEEDSTNTFEAGLDLENINLGIIYKF